VRGRGRIVATSQPAGDRRGAPEAARTAKAVDAALAADAAMLRDRADDDPERGRRRGSRSGGATEGRGPRRGRPRAGERATDEPVAGRKAPVTVAGARDAGWEALGDRLRRFGLDPRTWDAIDPREEGFDGPDGGVRPRWAAVGRVPDGFPRGRRPESGVSSRSWSPTLRGDRAIRADERSPRATPRARSRGELAHEDEPGRLCTTLGGPGAPYHEVRWLELAAAHAGVRRWGIAMLRAGRRRGPRGWRVSGSRSRKKRWAGRDEADVSDMIAPAGPYFDGRRDELPAAVASRRRTRSTCAWLTTSMAVSLIRGLFDSFGGAWSRRATASCAEPRRVRRGYRGGSWRASGPYHPPPPPPPPPPPTISRTVAPRPARLGRSAYGRGVPPGTGARPAGLRARRPRSDPKAAVDEPRFRVEGRAHGARAGMAGEARRGAGDPASGLRRPPKPTAAVVAQAILAGSDGELRAGRTGARTAYAGSS